MGVAANAVMSADKLRGGYYTPEPVARWLAAEVTRGKPCRVLEPSAGDGSLLRALVPRLPQQALVTAIEVDPVEAAKITAAVDSDSRVSVHVGDAFAWFDSQVEGGDYDVVIGNPPYIRYQHWPKEQSERALGLLRREGFRPTRLTNAWLPFVVLATCALRPGGTLALVLPAELLQVGYAGELRRYLSTEYDELTLVTFTELVFPDILQETVLLLGQKRVAGKGEARIRTVEVTNGDDLCNVHITLRDDDVARLDHSTEKWTKYLLTAREVAFLREAASNESLVRLGDVAEVDVGIVTGRNAVFVVTRTQASLWGLDPFCVPLVGRSAQIPGLVLAERDWKELYEADARVLLLNLPKVPRAELPKAVQGYIAFAEASGQHNGYKCQIRLPYWWALPATWAPDAFLLRQIYDGPRLVSNEASATCTDTLHKVRLAPGVCRESVCVSFFNSLTWAFAEVRGRSYGGGVLELEPSEAEALMLPTPRACEIALAELDDVVRRYGNAAGVEEVNTRLLEQRAGFTRQEVTLARDIARKLSARRLGRKVVRAN